jgi:hypothetical protein
VGITKAIRENRRREAEARNLAYSLLSLKDKLARQTPNGKVATKLLKAAVEAVKAEKAEKK